MSAAIEAAKLRLRSNGMISLLPADICALILINERWSLAVETIRRLVGSGAAADGNK
jgi:hypothetical protein